MESRHYLAVDMDAPEAVSMPAGQVLAYTRSSPAKDTGNEDCALVVSVSPDSCMLMVADGMGGHLNGAQASGSLTRHLEESVSAAGADETSLREAILSGIEQANLEMLGRETGEGTTVAVAEVSGGTVRAFHVGDSEVMVTGQRGRLKLQTISHSPTSYAVESGFIEEDQAVTHEDRHFVSNYVGQGDMHITMGSPVSLNPRDTVILATDGLFDNLYRTEVIEIIRKGPLAAAGNTLVELARSRMTQLQQDIPSKPDDMTFVLFRPAPAA